jgi:hypothetical protein
MTGDPIGDAVYWLVMSFSCRVAIFLARPTKRWVSESRLTRYCMADLFQFALVRRVSVILFSFIIGTGFLSEVEKVQIPLLRFF